MSLPRERQSPVGDGFMSQREFRTPAAVKARLSFPLLVLVLSQRLIKPGFLLQVRLLPHSFPVRHLAPETKTLAGARPEPQRAREPLVEHGQPSASCIQPPLQAGRQLQGPLGG